MALFDHVDWREIRERSRQPGWFQATIAAFQQRCQRHLGVEPVVPEQPGGWMHEYVCPHHWVPLTYRSDSPDQHRCPYGEVITGEAVHAAWLALRHRELSETARDLAILFRVTGHKRAAEIATTILTTYATRYASFAAGTSAQPWMLRGKAFQQALTEALWAIPLVHAYALLEPGFNRKTARTIRGDLFQPIAQTLSVAHDELVVAQGHVQSNYTAWLNAALGCLGFVLDDRALLDQAIKGPGGFYRHMSVAIRPDGLEYEGTPYYHNFVVLAYSILAEACLSHGMDLYAHTGPDGQSIRAMWDALVKLAHSDGELPLVADGAYWRNGPFDEEICQTYEIALARTGASRYAWLLKKTYERRGVGRDLWAAVLFARRDIDHSEPLHQGTALFPDSGFAVLRHPQNHQEALILFGPDGGSHTHRDRLSLALWPWSPDPGTPPYGIAARREWYQQTVAHNTIVIDGQSQAKPLNPCRVFKCGPHEIIVGGRHLYEGVNVVRRVRVKEHAVDDEVRVSAGDLHTVDWIFHADTRFEVEGLRQITPEPLHRNGPGAFVQVYARGQGGTEVSAKIRWQGRSYHMRLTTDRPCEVMLARCPGHARSPVDQRYVFVVRCRGRRVRFQTTFQELDLG